MIDSTRAATMGPWVRVIAIWSAAIVMAIAWSFVHARRDRWEASSAGLAAAAAGGTGAADGDPGGFPNRRSAGPAPLFSRESLPVERVERIEIVRGTSRIAFERRGEGWWQTEPFAQPADGALLRDLLLRASDLRASRAVEVAGAESAPASTGDAVPLATLGLDPPLAEVRVGFGAESRTLALGRRGVGGRAWLRVDDGPAFAVDPLLHDALVDGDPRRWRSWRLFDRVDAEVDRVVVERTPADPSRPAQRFELERRGPRWRLVAPVDTRVDESVVQALLAALARTEHAGFADDAPQDLALYGLERPLATVELHRRGAVERLEIGSALAKGGSVCARRTDRPPIVLLDQTALAALLPTAAPFVDPRPCGLVRADVRHVRIRDPKGEPLVELERSLDGWSLVGSDGTKRPARDASVRALLERLVDARAQELALQPMPPELLVATIELTPVSGAPVVLRVAREVETGKWAIDESDDALRVFPASFGLPLDARSYEVELGE